MIVLSFILIINFLFADYGGGYTGSGYRYGSNAREFALAGAIVADKNPGFYVFSNPALLQFCKKNHLGISYQKMTLDRSIQSINFSKRLPPIAGLGFAILRSGTKNIVGRDEMNNETNQFSAHETKGIISFGISLTSKFAIGINVKALFNYIDENYKGNGIATDIGIIYKFNRYIYLGALIKNLNANYNWKIIFDEDERTYQEKFPENYIIGITYSGLKRTTLFFQEDIMLLPNKHINYRLRIGTEYIMKNKIKLRNGFKQWFGIMPNGLKRNEINIIPTIGLGIPIKLWQKQYIKFDYALDLGYEKEGFSHLFSFVFDF